jgi:hypothetical protein
MTKDFCFSITNGVDGYLPDNVEFFRFDNADDALTAICDAIRNFREGGFNDVDPDAEFKEMNWRYFFERGCSAPDASMWSFQLCEIGREIMSVNGLTAAEYERENAE